MTDSATPVSSALPAPANWNQADASLAAANFETSIQKIFTDAKGDLPTFMALVQDARQKSVIRLFGDAPKVLSEVKQLAADAAPIVQAVKDQGHNRVFWILGASLLLHVVSKHALPATAPAWETALWPGLGGLAAILSAFLTHSANISK